MGLVGLDPHQPEAEISGGVAHEIVYGEVRGWRIDGDQRSAWATRQPGPRERLPEPVSLRVAAEHLDQQPTGPLGEVGRGRGAQETATVQDDHVVADLLQLAEQVRGDQDGDAEVAADPLHEVEHVHAGGRIEAVGGFVEEDQPGS